MKMEAQIRQVNMDSIIPNRFQPRLQFDDAGLAELAASIREHGIVQPLVVRRVADKYEIIAGERRYKAANLAGLTSVPVIVSDLDDNESAEVAIVENTHRRNMSAIEEAKAYQKLLDRKYVTQEQLAQRLGTSQSNVANKIRLLALDEAVQDALLKDRISERHARTLLRVTDKFKQVDLLNRIIAEKMPVRKLEEEVDAIVGSYKEKTTGTTGEVNANSRIDIDIEDVINNSSDIGGGTYTYKAKVEDIRKRDKDSLLFNNLENESANMDPTLNFGFNPFKNSLSTDNEIEDDYELLDLDDDDDDDDIEVFDENTGEVVDNIPVAEPVKEIEYNTLEDVKKGIEDIIKNATENGMKFQKETFDFDGYFQFIIRVDKSDQ